MNESSQLPEQNCQEDAVMESTKIPMLPSDGTLHAIAIEVNATQNGTLPRSLGRAIHAQVLAWLNLADPSIAQIVHDSQDNSFAISGLISNRRTGNEIRRGDRFLIRVSLLQGILLHPILQGLEMWGNKEFQLDRCSFIVRGIMAMPGSHVCVGSSSYELLFKNPQIKDDICLEFQSPTSFKHSVGIQPIPLPELVFGTLLRRWNLFAGETYRLPIVEWQGLISAAAIETRALPMENSHEIGSEGWVRYRFPIPEQAKIASILAHFAFFAGVGRKTSRGMGQTKLLKIAPISRIKH
jgi:CRISPR-associated endoribonuclease Cas6